MTLDTLNPQKLREMAADPRAEMRGPAVDELLRREFATVRSELLATLATVPWSGGAASSSSSISQH